jgi:hypothetical protein
MAVDVVLIMEIMIMVSKMAKKIIWATALGIVTGGIIGVIMVRNGML